MPTELIAATTSAATSSDFTVTDKTGISAYGFTSGSEFVAYVDKKNSDGSYDPLYATINPQKQPVRVVIDGLNRSFTISKIGVYRIRKLATEVAIGVDTD